MKIVSSNNKFTIEKELLNQCNTNFAKSFPKIDMDSISLLDNSTLVDINGDLAKDSFVHASLFSSAIIDDLKRDRDITRALFAKNESYIDGSLLETSDLRKQIMALEKVRDFIGENSSENLSDARVLIKTAIEKIGKEIKDLEKASLELDEPMNLPSSLPKINNSTFSDSFSL